MPQVGGKHYSYTKAGMKKAKKQSKKLVRKLKTKQGKRNNG